jgi:iron(III) transport system ATP-binding protein
MSESAAPAIEVDEMYKAFAGAAAVAGASLRVDHGAIVALVGPSGSGKTTLLRLIAGFEQPDAGTVRIGGRPVTGNGTWVEPEARRVGMVFQHGALFPHLTVGANASFGATRAERATESLELVDLAHRSGAYPHELSGGERQRLALARALAADPEVVLLDEPFAALDATLRQRLREEVAEILRAAGTSALLVTHDQSEALSLADTVAVMRAGAIEQTGSPQEVYERPGSRWVAEFLGDVDVLAGTAHSGVVRCALGSFPAGQAVDGTVEIGIRPESVGVGYRSGHGDGAEAIVRRRTFYGHDQLLHLELGDGSMLRSRRLGFPAWHPGDRVSVWLDGPASVLTSAAAHEPGATAR